MSSSTSANVTSGLNREKNSPNWSLTSDQVAQRLHAEMVGKTVIITGVSKDGLGAEAARVVSQHSPKLLLLASRNTRNVAEVIDAIKPNASPDAVIDAIKPNASPDAVIEPLELDLASQKSVRAAAAKVLEMTPVVDVLINNAGVMMIPTYQTTPEGIEMHFGTNHIGHFLFTNLLMPALRKAPAGPRVLNISSAGNGGSPVRFDDYNFGEGESYEPFLGYAQSKCANMLFSVALARKLGDKGLYAFSIDPGSVAGTNLSREIPKEELVARGWFLENGDPNPALPYKSAAQSVATYIMAAYDPSMKEHNGSALLACSIDTEVAPHSRDPESADKLWKLSEKLVGQEFNY